MGTMDHTFELVQIKCTIALNIELRKYFVQTRPQLPACLVTKLDK